MQAPREDKVLPQMYNAPFFDEWTVSPRRIGRGYGKDLSPKKGKLAAGPGAFRIVDCRGSPPEYTHTHTHTYTHKQILAGSNPQQRKIPINALQLKTLSRLKVGGGGDTIPPVWHGASF